MPVWNDTRMGLSSAEADVNIVRIVITLRHKHFFIIPSLNDLQLTNNILISYQAAHQRLIHKYRRFIPDKQ